MEANEKIFADAPQGVLGIEVTIPQLVEQCQLGNIDPQHSGGRDDLAAIEVAISHPLPPSGSVLATVWADLDAIGSMAVLALRARGVNLTPAMERVSAVAAADKTKATKWQGPRPLPTVVSPWGNSPEKPLAAIAAAVGDFRVPLSDRRPDGAVAPDGRGAILIPRAERDGGGSCLRPDPD